MSSAAKSRTKARYGWQSWTLSNGVGFRYTYESRTVVRDETVVAVFETLAVICGQDHEETAEWKVGAVGLFSPKQACCSIYFGVCLVGIEIYAVSP